MDAMVNNMEGDFFIDYLRDNFFWGGFPGFKHYVSGKHKNDPDWKFPLIELAYLTEGLLEF